MLNDNNLTEIEVLGLNSRYNLADGHSYLDAEEIYQDVLTNLPAIWNFAAKTPIPKMELYFKSTFADFHKLKGLHKQKHFSICPTASNSIDVVGAWAREKKLKVGLIEPTFDNLALLLRRREVEVVPVAEAVFSDLALLENFVEKQKLNALFLVNPNNPTGGVIGEDHMQKIIDICQRHSLVLILDTSFRFCHKWIVDEYSLLQAAEIPYIVLEDTGKIWPTLDTKASVLAYSADIAPAIRKIYEELYLCSSNLSLALIGAFIESTQAKGGKAFIHRILEMRLDRVERALLGLPVRLENRVPYSQMSIAWICIRETGMSDMEFVQYLQPFGLTVLPGRYFFWNSHETQGHDYVRVALLKPEIQFNESLEVLRMALSKIGNKSRPNELDMVL